MREELIKLIAENPEIAPDLLVALQELKELQQYRHQDSESRK